MRLRPINQASLLIIAVSVVAIAAILSRGNAQAQAVNAFGQGIGDGYYSQSKLLNPATSDVMDFLFTHGITQNWQTTPITVDNFLAEMRLRLDGANAADLELPDIQSSRAAGIIEMMLGKTGSTFGGDWHNGVIAAKADWPAWEAMVRNYDAAWKSGATAPDGTRWGVNFNDIFVGLDSFDNLGITNTAGPALRYPDMIYVQLVGQANEEAVIFHHADGTKFSILKKCFNLIGTSSSFPTGGPTPTPPTPAPTPPAPAPSPTPAPPHSFFEVNGGDIVAGATITTGNPVTVCGVPAPVATAGIVSWNKHGSPDYAGAGGQYAAFALDHIQDFVTGQGNNRVPAGQETNELTFSNANYGNSVNLTTGLFGGMFQTSPCADYWNDHPAAVTPLPGGSVDTWPSGIYYVTNNVTLAGAIIPSGKQITLYVDADVAIAGNVTYAAATYASRADIASFRLFVQGSIYINKDVNALDGVYAAIPDTGASASPNQFATPNAGTISTCSTGFTSYDPTEILGAYPTMDTDCNKKLVVTGSVIAQQVWLLRTHSGIGATTPEEAAEVFNYAPEVWLAPAGSSGASTSSDYQSIIGLPPIL